MNESLNTVANNDLSSHLPSVMQPLIKQGHPKIGVHTIIGASGTGCTSLACAAAAVIAKAAIKAGDPISPRPVIWIKTQESTAELCEKFTYALHGETQLEIGEGSSLQSARNHVCKGIKLVEPIGNKRNSRRNNPLLHITKLFKPGQITALFIDDIYTIALRNVSHDEHSSAVTSQFKAMLANCTRISQRLKIPVWIVHRIKSSLAQNPPASIFGLHDAAECKNFSEFVKTAIIIGNHDREGLFQISCAKPVSNDCPNRVVAKFSSSHCIVRATTEEQLGFAVPEWKQSRVHASDSFLKLLSSLPRPRQRNIDVE